MLSRIARKNVGHSLLLSEGALARKVSLAIYYVHLGSGGSPVSRILAILSKSETI